MAEALQIVSDDEDSPKPKRPRKSSDFSESAEYSFDADVAATSDTQCAEAEDDFFLSGLGFRV